MTKSNPVFYRFVQKEGEGDGGAFEHRKREDVFYLV